MLMIKCLRLESAQSSRGRRHRVDWGTFIKPGPRARVGAQSQRLARIELAPPRRRAPWRARSYAGAAQYPCAEHKGGSPRVAPSSTPSKSGLRACCSRCTCFKLARGRYRIAWGNGPPPIRSEGGRSSPSRAPAQAALPRTSARGRPSLW